MCRVPYLKDRNIRKSTPGESYEEKNKAYSAGVIEHYYTAYQKASIINEKLPIIATGHLTSAGSSFTDSEKEIGIGGLTGIDITSFTDKFDYFALGHMHKCQRIRENIIYSGSPIPLSFGEAETEKCIISLSIDKEKKVHKYELVKIPEFKKLRRIACRTDQISSEILKIKKEENESVWLQITLKDTSYLYKDITKSLKERGFEVLAIKIESKRDS